MKHTFILCPSVGQNKNIFGCSQGTLEFHTLLRLQLYYNVHKKERSDERVTKLLRAKKNKGKPNQRCPTTLFFGCDAMGQSRKYFLQKKNFIYQQCTRVPERYENARKYMHVCKRAVIKKILINLILSYRTCTVYSTSYVPLANYQHRKKLKP